MYLLYILLGFLTGFFFVLVAINLYLDKQTASRS